MKDDSTFNATLRPFYGAFFAFQLKRGYLSDFASHCSAGVTLENWAVRNLSGAKPIRCPTFGALGSSPN